MTSVLDSVLTFLVLKHLLRAVQTFRKVSALEELHSVKTELRQSLGLDVAEAGGSISGGQVLVPSGEELRVRLSV